MDIARRFIITTSTINTSYFSENCLYINCFIHNTIPGTMFTYSFDFITFKFCRKPVNQCISSYIYYLTRRKWSRRGERVRERKNNYARNRGYVEPSDITIRKNVYFSNEIKYISWYWKILKKHFSKYYFSFFNRTILFKLKRK